MHFLLMSSSSSSSSSAARFRHAVVLLEPAFAVIVFFLDPAFGVTLFRLACLPAYCLLPAHLTVTHLYTTLFLCLSSWLLSVTFTTSSYYQLL
ncbi:hypothetical protein F5Y07DRAFT_364008 [Xylaria sp. FL0933]|nr:hypothetical protein F5Y07DRAFT_364008 [Xylaria sp. FL0933]